jgi:hypothetical protein
MKILLNQWTAGLRVEIAKGQLEAGYVTPMSVMNLRCRVFCKIGLGRVRKYARHRSGCGRGSNIKEASNGCVELGRPSKVEHFHCVRISSSGNSCWLIGG